ncbi:MAG: sigma factor-like helix-turn-helix DNA-binding protein [Nocardioidaceae bacterium]
MPEKSYVEFVAAHWPEFYRLAFLLAWSDAAVEELLRTALKRAYAVWDELQRPGVAEGHVRRSLVRAAIAPGARHEQRSATHDRQVGGIVLTSSENPSSELVVPWTVVAALPARQRTVVALRYYEGLTENETAQLLGCSPRTVQSHTTAALRALGESATPASGGRSEGVGQGTGTTTRPVPRQRREHWSGARVEPQSVPPPASSATR